MAEKFSCNIEGSVTSDDCYNCFQKNKRAASRVLCKQAQAPKPVLTEETAPEPMVMKADPADQTASVSNVLDAYREKGLI